MVKIFFENRFILTKKLYHQYCRETYQAMRKSVQLLAFVLALMMYILWGIFQFYLSRTKLGYVFLGFGIYFTLMLLLGYRFSEWLNFRKMQDEYGTAITMVLHFLQDKVDVRINEKSIGFKYSTISKAYETEDTLILILGRQGMIEHGQILFKNGFTQGATVEEFKQYINKKTKKEIFDLSAMSGSEQEE